MSHYLTTLRKVKDTMPIHLLLVEDNPGDALLLQHMLDSQYPGQYAICHHGNSPRSKGDSHPTGVRCRPARSLAARLRKD